MMEQQKGVLILIWIKKRTNIEIGAHYSECIGKKQKKKSVIFKRLLMFVWKCFLLDLFVVVADVTKQ